MLELLTNQILKKGLIFRVSKFIFGSKKKAEVVKWQTHHLEGVAPRGMRVQVPPSAPDIILSVILGIYL